MCLTKRHYLHGSARADVREIWANFSSEHVETDQLIVSHDSLAAASKKLASVQQKKASGHLFGLQLQGALAKSLSESVPGKNIELWVTTLNSLPAHLFNFARKAFLQVLPTASNLKRWNRRARSAPAARRKPTNMFCRTVRALLPSTAIPSVTMRFFLC